MAVDSHGGELVAGVVGVTGVGDRYAHDFRPTRR
jgi:hypothetical protein